MKRLCILSLSLVLPACSGDDSTPPGETGNSDASVMDSSIAEDAGITQGDTGLTQEDTGTRADTGTTPADSGQATTDSGESDAASADAAADASPEVDASCPATWYEAPTVDPSIAVPDGGGGVLLHAIGTGTQNYKCLATTPTDGGADRVRVDARHARRRT